MRNSIRQAFSLIELMVVMAILAVLTALMLAAAQKAREAASRAVCMNNLRQLAVAVHMYADTNNGNLPLLYASSNQLSWVTQILPFIEEQNLYNQYNFDYAWYDATNAQVVNQRLPVMECPSNPVQPRVFTDTDTQFATQADGTGASPSANTTYTAAAVDYFAFSGISSSSYSTAYPGAGSTVDTSGAFGAQSSTPTAYALDQITDGTSNTAMISEMAGRPWLYVAGGMRPTSAPSYDSAGSSTTGASWQEPLNYGFGAWAQNNNYNVGSWSANGMSSSGPCAINCSNYRGVYSFHTGTGAYAAFADGSVHLLAQSMSPAIFFALVTARGGESVDGSAY